MTDKTQQAVEALRVVIHELRTYSPPADPYKGEHIHPGWANRIEAAIAALQAEETEQRINSGEATEALELALVDAYETGRSGGVFPLNGTVEKVSRAFSKAQAALQQAEGSIVDAVDDPNGTCPTCHQTLHVEPQQAEDCGAPKHCTWSQDDEMGDMFSTGCGHDYMVIDGEPGGMRFCVYCGGRMAIELHSPLESEDE